MQAIGGMTEGEREVGKLIFAAIDEALNQWVSADEEIVWRDEALLGGFAVKHVLAVDQERESARLLRSWVSASLSGEAAPDPSEVMVSADLEKNFEQMTCDPDEIDEMSFPHSDARLGVLGEHHEPIFLKRLGGDVKFLWKMDQMGRTSFLGRVARVGREEALFGGSITHTAGNPEVSIDFEMPLSEIFPRRCPSYR